jgi:hypothetical protein
MKIHVRRARMVASAKKIPRSAGTPETTYTAGAGAVQPALARASAHQTTAHPEVARVMERIQLRCRERTRFLGSAWDRMVLGMGRL